MMPPLFVLPNPSGRNANFSHAEMLAAFTALKRWRAKSGVRACQEPGTLARMEQSHRVGNGAKKSSSTGTTPIRRGPLGH